MKISIPTEYVMGHLRYGHYEAEITPEQYEALKNGDELIQEEVLEDATFIIDDWEIEGTGPIEIAYMKIIEE